MMAERLAETHCDGNDPPTIRRGETASETRSMIASIDRFDQIAIHCFSSFPGSAWERAAGRLCLPRHPTVDGPGPAIRTAEPCERAFPGGAWVREELEIWR